MSIPSGWALSDLHHLGLTVSDIERSIEFYRDLLVDDLVASYEDLRSRDVRFRSEPVTITAGPNKGGLVVYMYDPDGYVLELFQPAPSSA